MILLHIKLYYGSLLFCYYFIITMLLHIVVKLLHIILLLLHHYYVLLWLLLRIIILLLHYYYVIITHYYGAIITYYYVITNPLLPISTRSIIGNNGAIITYYWPVEFADALLIPSKVPSHSRSWPGLALRPLHAETITIISRVAAGYDERSEDRKTWTVCIRNLKSDIIC